MCSWRVFLSNGESSLGGGVLIIFYGCRFYHARMRALDSTIPIMTVAVNSIRIRPASFHGFPERIREQASGRGKVDIGTPL